MMKVVWFFCISLTLFANPISLQFQEISTWHKHTNETEKVLISREKKSVSMFMQIQRQSMVEIS